MFVFVFVFFNCIFSIHANTQKTHTPTHTQSLYTPSTTFSLFTPSPLPSYTLLLLHLSDLLTAIYKRDKTMRAPYDVVEGKGAVRIGGVKVGEERFWGYFLAK